MSESTDEMNAAFLERFHQKWGIPVQDLKYLHSNLSTAENMYRFFTIRKRSSPKDRRRIDAPHGPLKEAQRQILCRLRMQYTPHAASKAYHPKASVVGNATPHVGKTFLYKLDIAGFFPSITTDDVINVLRFYGSTDEELMFLVRLTTLNGALPQGAPTSPILSDMVCYRMDVALSAFAASHALTYTRYADDMTFSANVDFSPLVPAITSLIQRHGFQVHIAERPDFDLDAAVSSLRAYAAFEPSSSRRSICSKTGMRQIVTGLTIARGKDKNGNNIVIPRLPTAWRRRLRAVVHHYCCGRPMTWRGRTINESGLWGLVAHLRAVHPHLGREYEAKIKARDCHARHLSKADMTQPKSDVCVTTKQQEERLAHMKNALYDRQIRIIDWLARTPQVGVPLRAREGFQVHRGTLIKLRSGETVEALEWLAREGFHSNMEIGTYSILHSSKSDLYEEKLTFFKKTAVAEAPFDLAPPCEQEV